MTLAAASRSSGSRPPPKPFLATLMTARLLPWLLTWSTLSLTGCADAATPCCPPDSVDVDEPDATGCRAVTEARREPLIDHDLWRLAEPDEDPWRAHRPEDITCDPTGRQPEDFAGTYSFGIDTALCAYTTVIQETATDLCPGEEVLVWLWRFALTGPEGANAHIAAMVGDELLFEDIVPIPATSGLKVDPYVAKRFHPAGTPITFHIRNHGNNTYQLLELSRCQGTTCRPN